MLRILVAATVALGCSSLVEILRIFHGFRQWPESFDD
jgi:plasmid stabilization system protein ParE